MDERSAAGSCSGDQAEDDGLPVPTRRRHAVGECDLDELTRRFDEVQRPFGPHPSAYTGLVLSALAGVPVGQGPCLVELGCGTATGLAAMARRDSRVRCVGVEADPVLLHLARRVRGVDVVDGDFRGAAGLHGTSLRPGEVDVVLAVRALHYPDPDELADTYAGLVRLLRVGGVLVNADRFPGGGPAEPSAASQAALEAWSLWWTVARSCPALAEAFRDRDGRPSLGAGNRSSAVDHARLLQAAGCASVDLTELGGGDAIVVATR